MPKVINKPRMTNARITPPITAVPAPANIAIPYCSRYGAKAAPAKKNAKATSNPENTPIAFKIPRTVPCQGRAALLAVLKLS